MDQTFHFIIFLSLLITPHNILAEAGVVGVNYGMLGDNLPTPKKVVALLKSRNIGRVRLFDPNHEALNALQGSQIEVILGTLNQDLPRLGTDPSFAKSWVETNVIPYAKTIHFRYVTAGNEVVPSNLAEHVLPAMNNLNAALKAANLRIPISTVVSTAVLGMSYPPSRGVFSENLALILRPIVAFLETNKSPLLVNVYPYFAYIDDPRHISLEYALFRSQGVVIRDGTLCYKNLFDAMIDATYSALEKMGGDSIDIVVSESGWPSAENGDATTIANAWMYNNNLITHVSGMSGTPKRPGKSIETYLFAIFNEDLKPAGTEQNFGLYHPNMTEVYHVNFSS